MHPNLVEQLNVFRTVVDCCSFTEAAEKLHRTPSSVSYTISNLEKHLGLSLFDRSSYRPTLTAHGFAIYEDADLILRRVDRLQARVVLLKDSFKAELKLSVDALFPREVLVEALWHFNQSYPQVAVHIRQRDMKTTREDVINGVSDLGATSVDARLKFRDIDAMQIGFSENLPVAAPSHALAQHKKPFSMSALENHRQIVLSRDNTPRGEEHYVVHKTEVWNVSDTETLIALVKKNLGWAYVHRHFIWKDLQTGDLVILNCKDIHDWNRPRFAIIWHVAAPLAGPKKRLAELLQDLYPTAFPGADHIA